MATVKYGAGIIQMSGSIAGVTHARNRFGNYIRPRTKPVNPRSNRQSTVRNIVKMLTAYWSTAAMSDTERGAWATYAAAIPFKNRLGENMYITGFNHFIRSNIARITAGSTLIESGPSTLSLPGGDDTIAVTGDSGGQLLTIAFDDTKDWCSETGAFMSINMGQPQLHTRNFFGGPFRNAGALVGNAGVPLTSPQTMAVPFSLVTGQKVWVNARIILADGRCSNPFFAPALTVDGLLNVYYAAGSTLPDFDGDYLIQGAYNGKAYFRESTGKSFIWWDGSSKWIMSVLLGLTETDYQELETASIEGLYTLMGGATGAATVTAGYTP